MPDPQKFLISVERLCTSDEADLVTKWSAVVEDKNIPNLTLADAARLTEVAMERCPAANIRPMTDDEIREWRDGQRD